MTQQRKGFATIVALFLLGLLMAALAATVAVSQVQFRRTLAMQQTAQLRQLMLAGTIEAAGRMKNFAPGDKQSWEIQSPDQQGVVKLTAQETQPGQLIVEMSVSVGVQHMQQTLRFAQHDAGWNVIAIEHN
jgi:hypothetical protein